MDRTVLPRFLGQCDDREELNAPIPLEGGRLAYTNGHVFAVVPHKVAGYRRTRYSTIIERYYYAIADCRYEPLGEVAWPDETPCVTCEGTGRRRLRRCEACAGSGVDTERGGTCGACHGAGLVVVECDDRTCPACLGCGVWPWPIWGNVSVGRYQVTLLGCRFDAKYIRLLLDLAGEDPLEIALGVATDSPDGVTALFWRAGRARGALMPLVL